MEVVGLLFIHTVLDIQKNLGKVQKMIKGVIDKAFSNLLKMLQRNFGRFPDFRRAKMSSGSWTSKLELDLGRVHYRLWRDPKCRRKK